MNLSENIAEHEMMHTILGLDRKYMSISGGPTAMENPMTSLGDMIMGGDSGAPVRLPPSFEGRVLKISAGGIPAWEIENGSGIGWVGEAEYKDELPDAALHDDEVWYVMKATGFSLIPFKLPTAKGLYRSNHDTWEYAGAVEYLLDDSVAIFYDNIDKRRIDLRV